MIEALRSEEIVKKVGGRFRLTALIQRRLAELVRSLRSGPDLTLRVRRGQNKLDLQFVPPGS